MSLMPALIKQIIHARHPSAYDVPRDSRGAVTARHDEILSLLTTHTPVSATHITERLGLNAPRSVVRFLLGLEKRGLVSRAKRLRSSKAIRWVKK